METHEIIKDLRIKRGLSQGQLATMVGYKDRSSIAKVEAGKVDLSQSKIAAFADALNVTPADLIGLDQMFLEEIVEDSRSGRTAAKEEMYRVFGSQFSVEDLRLIGNRTAVLYYKAVSRNCAPELLDIIMTADKLDHTELDKLRCFIHAYLRADAPIRDIVDTALRPYKEEDLFSEEIG